MQQHYRGLRSLNLSIAVMLTLVSLVRWVAPYFLKGLLLGGLIGMVLSTLFNPFGMPDIFHLLCERLGFVLGVITGLALGLVKEVRVLVDAIVSEMRKPCT